MAQNKIQQEQSSFSPTTLLELFTLDATSIGLSTIYRFHAGTNERLKPITFNGLEYTPFPLRAEGYEYDGKGGVSRPKITLSNVNGFLSNLLLQNANLIGAKVTRTRVFARFIDAVNFTNGINPYGTPDPTAAYPDDIYYVNRKIAENQSVVSFELSSVLDIEGAELPRRQILANICPFRFRDPESCQYTGVPIADRNNKTFLGAGGYAFGSLTDQGEWSSATTYTSGDYIYIVSQLAQTLGDKLFYVCNAASVVGNANSPINNPGLWLADACSKTPAGCKIHYPNQPLKFGGFPGVTRGLYNFTI